MADVPEDWERVAAVVQQRRREIGVSAARLAVDADVSTTTLSKIETGKGATPAVLEKVSTALRWPKDALLRVARGEPEPEHAAEVTTVGPWPSSDPDALVSVPASVLVGMVDEMRRLRLAVEALEARDRESE